MIADCRRNNNSKNQHNNHHRNRNPGFHIATKDGHGPGVSAANGFTAAGTTSTVFTNVYPYAEDSPGESGQDRISHLLRPSTINILKKMASEARRLVMRTHIDEADVQDITVEQKTALLVELTRLADSQPEKFPVPLLNVFTDILKLTQNPHWNKFEFHIYYGFPHTRIFTELQR